MGRGLRESIEEGWNGAWQGWSTALGTYSGVVLVEYSFKMEVYGRGMTS